MEPLADIPPRALVVDDESTIRSALARYFRRLGWEVDEAEDGAAAGRFLFGEAARDYTVVVCDLRMPGVSGIDLHARVERERPALLDRLIFSSGDLISEEAEAFLARVRSPVLQKPFELSALRALVDRVRQGA